MKSASGVKTKIVLGVAALALGLVTVNSFSPVLAYRGDSNVRSPNYIEARHNSNIEAFKTGDYKKWLANMEGRGVTRFVNQKNFSEFAQAQVAAQNGDTTQLNNFRSKYGMGQGSNKMGRGMNR